ncbi:hypothetical protein CG747_32730 [Streptomyces sp. CB02959]|uniref:IS3 family transposase n=1 Tax=Streptomyces sp. CB02959 TaxID=2020330 RepID=UPI000C2743B8|nr:hypothetical protein CG747_32730 [Streptomyces sp. CB02959]
MTEQVRQIHHKSRGICGSPRVHTLLKRASQAVDRKRVKPLMSGPAREPQSPPQGVHPPRPQGRTAPGLANRNFTAPAPNRLWATEHHDPQR